MTGTGGCWAARSRLAGASGQVVIGLTTDTFAHRKVHPIRPFAVRKAELETAITAMG